MMDHALSATSMLRGGAIVDGALEECFVEKVYQRRVELSMNSGKGGTNVTASATDPTIVGSIPVRE